MKLSSKDKEILYPKKNDDDTSKLEPLSNAFIWAFQDENQTGEPNYNDYVEGETFIYNEAYVETNEDGYFSLIFQKPGSTPCGSIFLVYGKYGICPFHFELKRDQELVLGNTIRLDWKNKNTKLNNFFYH